MIKQAAVAMLLSSSTIACDDSNAKTVRDVEERVDTVVDKVDELRREIEDMVRQRRSAAKEHRDEASVRRP